MDSHRKAPEAMTLEELLAELGASNWKGNPRALLLLRALDGALRLKSRSPHHHDTLMGWRPVNE